MDSGGPHGRSAAADSDVAKRDLERRMRARRAQAEIAISFFTGYYEEGGMYVDDLSSVGAAPSVLQI